MPTLHAYSREAVHDILEAAVIAMRSFHENAEQLPPEGARALLVAAVDGIRSNKVHHLKTKEDFEFLQDLLMRYWDGTDED